MKYSLEENQNKLKKAHLEAIKFKNQHTSLTNHLVSMKESYEKNVIELTEKLSVNTFHKNKK